MPTTSETATRRNPLRRAAGGFIALLVLAVGLLLFVRPTTVSTGPDQVALHYSDGAFTPRRFQDCVASSTRAWDGPGDKHYAYPKSQRNYVFGEGGVAREATAEGLPFLGAFPIDLATRLGGDDGVPVATGAGAGPWLALARRLVAGGVA